MNGVGVEFLVIVNADSVENVGNEIVRKDNGRVDVVWQSAMSSHQHHGNKQYF